MKLRTTTLALTAILSNELVFINSKKPAGCLSESDITFGETSPTNTIYGTNYQGREFRTQRGQKCLKWTGSKAKRIAKGGKYSEHINTIKDLDGSANHNYCRNPDGSAYPWCYIEPKKLKMGAVKNWDYCKPLKKCKNGIQKVKGQEQVTIDVEEPMCGLSCKKGYKHCTFDLSKRVKADSRMIAGKSANTGEFPWMASLYDPCYDTRKNKPCRKTRSNNKNGKGQVFCGASILNRNWILTAAHCIQNTNGKTSNYKTLKAASGNVEATRAKALVGYKDWHETPDRTLKAHKRKFNSLGRDEIPIFEFIVHEKYDPAAVINDIALGLLDRPVNYNNLMDVGGMTLVRPICIPTVELEGEMLAESTTKTGKHLKKCFLSGHGDTNKTMIEETGNRMGLDKTILQKGVIPVYRRFRK